jgi:two-component SAPR family response regulator
MRNYKKRYSALNEAIKTLQDVQIKSSPSEVDGASAYRDSLTYSLRIWVLGQQIIERDGEFIQPSDWEAAGSRELFFYLLFNRPSTREQIGLALWPDISVQQLRQIFHATLHRVRDAVGSNVIIFDNELYSINPDIALWCDVKEFKAAVKRAKLSSPLLAHSEILWRRAVDLFCGEFLPEFDSDWITGHRTSLTATYIDSLMALANCVRTRGDIQEAITFLKRALEIEPFQENIHRSLLSCYRLLGDNSLIARHLHKMTELFWDELGAEPSPETREFANHLRH